MLERGIVQIFWDVSYNQNLLLYDAKLYCVILCNFCGILYGGPTVHVCVAACRQHNVIRLCVMNCTIHKGATSRRYHVASQFVCTQ